jgi:hypothetical protein
VLVGSVYRRGLTWWIDGQLTEDVPKSLSREFDLHFHGPLYYTSFSVHIRGKSPACQVYRVSV